jgi:hypothetical protein
MKKKTNGDWPTNFIGLNQAHAASSATLLIAAPFTM